MGALVAPLVFRPAFGESSDSEQLVGAHASGVRRTGIEAHRLVQMKK